MVVQQRFVLGILIFCGLITNYMLRVNISIAIGQAPNSHITDQALSNCQLRW